MDTRSDSAGSKPPRLLQQVSDACRARQFSARTGEAYVAWVRRYVLYHGKQHPATLHGDHVTGFLTALATRRNVSASTQRQAASALLFSTATYWKSASRYPTV